MKFEHSHFSCDVDIFTKKQDIVVRFYDKHREQSENEIVNCVIVDPGFGYLCLKVKGAEGLLSGYLDENVFGSDEIVWAAIEFVENLSPNLSGVCVPHHIDRIRTTTFVEYNGEY